MRLIDDWRRSYRLFSVQTLAAIALVSAAEVALPFFDLPRGVVPVITAALAVAGIVLRNVRQEPKDGK